MHRLAMEGDAEGVGRVGPAHQGSLMDAAERAREFSALRRLHFRLAEFYEEPSTVIAILPLEWFVLFFALLIIDVAVAFETNFTVVASVPDLALYAVMFVVLQTMIALAAWTDTDYALYLARQVRESGATPTASHELETPPVRVFRYHMKAMRRIGRALSGGYADDLIQLALPEDTWKDKEGRPKSFFELARAIELGLVEQATEPPAYQRKNPFVLYADDFERTFASGKFTFPSWRRFLSRWYNQESTTDRVKILAKGHVPQPLASVVRTEVGPWQILGVILASVLSATAGALVQSVLH